MEPVLPDYGGACISRVVPAVLGMAPADWLPEPVQGAQAVVLLMLDGLGWQALREHPDALPTLAAMTGGPITTVVPSTTATALTSLTTGLAPSRHGVTGFRIAMDGSVLNVLRWARADRRSPPDPLRLQRHAAFLGREVPVVTRAEYRNTGFTKVHLDGAPFLGWSAPSVLVERCRRLVGDGTRLVYAYYPGIDTVAHEFGLRDGYYAAELASADRLVADLLHALPAHVALLVTSDHGQVHLDLDGWIGMEPLADLVAVHSGDGRFRSLHAAPGAAAELHRAAADHVGDRAWVRTRDELLDDGWFGADPTPATRRRIGDVVVAAQGPVGFVDPRFTREAKLRSAHGSVTREEMLVPLLARRGEERRGA